MSQHTHLRHGSGRARQTHSPIASPPLRARTPAFLKLEFRSIHWPPNRRPRTRVTLAPPSQLCKYDVVAGPNVVKSGSHHLRVSTKSEGSPVSRTSTLPMTGSSRPNHNPNPNP